MFSSINLWHIRQRLCQMRPLNALLSLLLIIVGSLILLPLILLFLIVGFIGMTLLSRQYLGKQTPASNMVSSTNLQQNMYQQHPNIERECSVKQYKNNRTINH
ncbi:hypothetical protein [Shewanella ulleungensis]|uniref:Uncharacterized protein n=1 Tax=Shewanella ulleungensis TaxID=2282699 RepID=A0ABQ2QTH2_9GAMM|nr:hypothetical protein [Shewanella ulleungensis]MCL1150770.1 hypothetical protein [Shewanella ulleungensis]GGP93730.1 hypothetical protein GCM10009410_29680 [Shewanella ulleungensis]